MKDRDARTIQMIGVAGMDKLRAAKVLIVGVGGVGSYAAEAIARTGVGAIAVCDGDKVAPSNLNRQLIALASTINQNKADVMAARIRDINPDCRVTSMPIYYRPARPAVDSATPSQGSTADTPRSSLENLSADAESADWLAGYDFIIDAIDDIDAKVDLIKNALVFGIPIISAMGAAGKFDITFKVADISNTTVCPLAKIVRKRLRAEGIEHLPVVYSEEKPIPRNGELGTMSYVPGAMGLALAGYVIRELIKTE